MSAIAEAPSQNGHGPDIDPAAYREAVKATMKKREPAPGGGFLLIPPTDAEVSRFLLECRVYGLEPLGGQIYAVWENGVMRAVTTIDGMRALAERTGRYDGQSDPEWCDKEGNWTDYWSGGETPLAARVRVHRKGTKVPTTGTANWSDFAPPEEVGEDSMWTVGTGKPAHVLSIRAEQLALRKAFPSELSGLYTAEELGISLAALSASGEQGTPSAAVDVPASPAPPSAPSAASPAPASAEEEPAVIVDSAADQPSGAPARPETKRTLSEVLAGAECDRLRGDLTEALFDQMPDRLTDEQSEVLTSALAEAEEAGITPVELERLCKVSLREAKESVGARSKFILGWIAERRHKAEDDDQVSTASDAGSEEAEQPADSGYPLEHPSLLDPPAGEPGE